MRRAVTFPSNYSLFILVYMCVVLSGCTTTRVGPPAGTTCYTKANIWYTTPSDIKSTNYHMGAMIPFGTKVTIDDIDRKRLVFTTENSMRCTIIYMQRHSTISLLEHFHRYFSETNPRSRGSMFEGFSDMEKQNVKKGNVATGMCKEAVLASYGYPPSHATPELNVDYWRYWVIGRQQVSVYFFDDKVSRIERISVFGPPPGLKRITSVSSLEPLE